MARLDWTTFLATHPQAHLLAGHVPEPNPTVLKRLRRLMQTLIDGEAPVGEVGAAQRRVAERAPPAARRAS
jgi:hypothetical protein